MIAFHKPAAPIVTSSAMAFTDESEGSDYTLVTLFPTGIAGTSKLASCSAYRGQLWMLHCYSDVRVCHQLNHNSTAIVSGLASRQKALWNPACWYARRCNTSRQHSLPAICLDASDGSVGTATATFKKVPNNQRLMSGVSSVGPALNGAVQLAD